MRDHLLTLVIYAIYMTVIIPIWLWRRAAHHDELRLKRNDGSTYWCERDESQAAAMSLSPDGPAIHITAASKLLLKLSRSSVVHDNSKGLARTPQAGELARTGEISDEIYTLW
jgi:hypothetical protein